MERIHKLLEFLEKSPNDPFLKHALGLEYKKLNQFQDALNTWEALLEVTPEYVGTYYHLAHLLLEMNQTDRAIHYFEKGLAVAQEVKDRHAYAELKAAYDDLMY